MTEGKVAMTEKENATTEKKRLLLRLLADRNDERNIVRTKRKDCFVAKSAPRNDGGRTHNSSLLTLHF